MLRGVLFLAALYILGAWQTANHPLRPSDDQSKQDQSVSVAREDPKRKGMEISFSYDELGRISEITIQSNQADPETRIRSLVDRKNVDAIIEELIPAAERGAKVMANKGLLNRAAFETAIYEKVQIDLTTACDGDVCGVSLARIKWRTSGRN